jgi:predicted negative regulator of RcsB-dependent stress response
MPGKARVKHWIRVVVIGATLSTLSAGSIGLWFIRWRSNTDSDSRAIRAYGAGNWGAAAELAREILAARKNDSESLRVLARANAQLGRDDAAIAIYQRRLDEKRLEAEDHLLLGLMLQRKGRNDLAGREWKKALDTGKVSPSSLEELTRLAVRGRRWDEAIRAAERLSREPGWEARGFLMLGTIRLELNNVPSAALSFRRALDLNPEVVDKSHDPTPLRKLMARTFLRIGLPDEALQLLQTVIDRATDPESAWLQSRAYLQRGDKTKALAALKQSGTYRADNPFEVEPGPFVGEVRCETCHSKIFRDSLASRHTQTYYRGVQLDDLPLPDQPLADPDDSTVTHAIRKRDGVIREDTTVGHDVYSAVIDYAFGTRDRSLTMVGRDEHGRYHIGRLSYYDTSEGRGWDRSTLDTTHPTRAHPDEFQGEMVAVRDGLVKCLYCHVTNPRTGQESIGPEIADRAIGCERCHGPGGNHVLALQAGLPDLAIVNPAGASPQAVTIKLCNDCHILQTKFGDKEPENVGWVRSQGIGWSRSRCTTESGSAFGCVTCHDPHASARSTSTADYELKCLTCHSSTGQHESNERRASSAGAGSGQAFRICPVNPSKDCIQCHMPSIRIDLLHTDLTDHYIRINGQKAPK